MLTDIAHPNMNILSDFICYVEHLRRYLSECPSSSTMKSEGCVQMVAYNFDLKVIIR